MRGVPLDTLVDRLRAEIGHSTNPAVGINSRDYLVQVLRRTQDRLWEEYDWSHLKVSRDIDTQAGVRYYSCPNDLMYERIIEVAFKYGDDWHPLTHGIDEAEYSVWDSDRGIKSWPLIKWDIAEDTGVVDDIGVIEIWPVPSRSKSSTDGQIRLTGFRNIAQMVDGASKCELDGTLIVLMAAAEIQARQNQADAQIKLQAAQSLLSRLMNQTSNKKKSTSFNSGEQSCSSQFRPREISSVTSYGSGGGGTPGTPPYDLSQNFLNNLGDVNTFPIEGHVLTWDQATKQWISKAPETSTPSEGVEEAPIDGKPYLRRDASWEIAAEVTGDFVPRDGSTPMYGNLEIELSEAGDIDGLTIKSTQDSGTDMHLRIGGARSSSGDNVANVDFMNYANQSTGGEYELASIQAGDPLGDAAQKDGELRFYTSKGGVLFKHMELASNGNLNIYTRNSTLWREEEDDSEIRVEVYAKGGDDNIQRGGIRLFDTDGNYSAPGTEGASNTAVIELRSYGYQSGLQGAALVMGPNSGTSTSNQDFTAISGFNNLRSNKDSASFFIGGTGAKRWTWLGNNIDQGAGIKGLEEIGLHIDRPAGGQEDLLWAGINGRETLRIDKDGHLRMTEELGTNFYPSGIICSPAGSAANDWGGSISLNDNILFGVCNPDETDGRFGGAVDTFCFDYGFAKKNFAQLDGAVFRGSVRIENNADLIMGSGTSNFYHSGIIAEFEAGINQNSGPIFNLPDLSEGKWGSSRLLAANKGYVDDVAAAALNDALTEIDSLKKTLAALTSRLEAAGL